jgi:hypothetical protein
MQKAERAFMVPLAVVQAAGLLFWSAAILRRFIFSLFSRAAALVSREKNKIGEGSPQSKRPEPRRRSS